MVSAKSPPSTKIQTPPLSNIKTKSPRSPRSPRSKPTESFTPLSSILTDEPMSTTDHSPPTKGLALRRVLSGGSSSASTLPTTPTGSSVPLSPSSTGIRTPRAKKNPLKVDAMDVDVSSKEGGHQLANHLDGLQVNSPHTAIPPSTGMPPSALGITQVLGHQSDLSESPDLDHRLSNTNTNGKTTTHDRSYSTSTEGSTTSYHPQIPSHLGSSYGPEGFPRYSRSPENSPNIFNSSQQSINGNGYHASLNVGFGGADANGKNIDPELAMRQAEALAKADEAVRALNGTSSLYQSTGQPMFEPYVLQHRPPGEVNFVTPQQQPSVVRQSSTSSSTTDAASTSSEESDWCIPSIEWVSTNPQSPRFLSSGYPPGFAQASRDRAGSNSNRMPPPPVATANRPTSPRAQDSSVSQRPGVMQHQQSLPIGASASTPSGIKASSALPLGIAPDGQAEDDDEEITVGHERRSPSTSSQSAQSGLDLLWRAAASQSHKHPQAIKPQLPVYEHSNSFDHKGKRKAGAEAVDKWRSSGIPTGLPPPTPTSLSTQNKPASTSANEPPKKRRRSEMTMEPMDVPHKRELSEEAVEEEQEREAETPSEYKSPSVSSEPVSDGNDSEYGGGPKRGRPAGRGGRAIAGTKRATASAKAGAGGKVMINPANAPGGVTKGGTIKKVRKVGDSPPGGNRGGRRASGGGGGVGSAAGVQCEYVNPLPPYNRCTDVFTRKYDLPRHMARHARREGELVLDGKLSEEKAVLWRTIKDKPKVTCNECGENFTRMDALKRHQAKQHHH
ncbi:hypothetical protein I302_108889 [Kwoniella bestiolae CBS 10118]|uniref:C2H2-type domain-containing protein n=1 Tax=Kwoniella bestiolae CBS 10118 TaxID=1296100 RepID=A0A1B9FUC7_9TREE|nr:hypothetical protein I302_08026 [Kwoniella bestiolae CBS 10118]OCF22379.1 hypothetical protein I302_08026 [Kwoniella bestiolae CBS 10118]